MDSSVANAPSEWQQESHSELLGEESTKNVLLGTFKIVNITQQNTHCHSEALSEESGKDNGFFSR